MRIRTINNVASIEEAKEGIIKAYKAGHTYFDGRFEHNKQCFNVRMNKDHNMKGWNNYGSDNVLSIVYNAEGSNNCRSYDYANDEGKLIMQKVQHYRVEPDEGGKREIDQYELDELEDILFDFLGEVFEMEADKEDDEQ